MEKECLYCGKTIKVKPSHYERKKYCSRKCQFSYQKDNPPDFWFASSFKKIVNCSNCNKELLRKPSSISKKNFCCRSCKIDFQRKNSKELSNQLRERFSKNCIVCGKEYDVIKSRLNTSKYCSKECLGKANGDRGKFAYRKRVVINCTNCNRSIEKNLLLLESTIFVIPNVWQTFMVPLTYLKVRIVVLGQAETLTIMDRTGEISVGKLEKETNTHAKIAVS